MAAFFVQIKQANTECEQKPNTKRYTSRTRSKPLFMRVCGTIIFLGGTTVGTTNGHANRHARTSV